MKLIVDGNGFAFRAMHSSVEPLINANGVDITVIFMIVNMLKYLIKDKNELTEIIFTWDIGKSKAKTELTQEYKANREMTEDKLRVIKQIDIIQKYLFPHLGIKQVVKKGIEADDIIAVLAQAFALNKTAPEEVLIVSSDKDLLQLVNIRIHVFNPIKKVEYDIENFETITHLPREGFIDYLCLLGDDIDNIKGIDGIGESTAKWAIKRYKTLDNIYKCKEELELLASFKGPDKANAKRVLSIFEPENINKLKLNKDLITLGKLLTTEEKKDIVVHYVNDNAKVDSDKAYAFFKEYQLLEFQRQHDDIMHIFASISPKRNKSTYLIL